MTVISHATIAALPKIDLHRHLEGSLRLTTLLEVARSCHLDVPHDDLQTLRPYVQVIDEGGDFRSFLSKFGNLRKFFQSREVIERFAYEAVADAAFDNVRYLELRFTPMALAKLQNYALEEVTDWVINAVEKAQHDHPTIRVKLIVSTNRHEDVSIAQRALQVAVDNKHRGIVGFDLAGDEANYPAQPFAKLFQKSLEAGLQNTVHAGEWGSVENIQYAIEALGATRIGHGVKVMEDSLVLALARKKNVTFEVCVTSNVQSGVFRRFVDHPIKEMYNDVNLRVTINTDDPAVSDITLSDEIHIIAASFSLDLEDIKRMTLLAAESAYLPEAERAALVEQFKKELDEIVD